MGWLKIFPKAIFLWQRYQVPRLGAALAFYAVLSLAPLVIVAVGIVSLFLSRSEVQQGIIEQVRNAIGEESDQIVTLLQNLFNNAFSAYHANSGIVTSAFWFVVVIIGASAILVELRDSLNLIWGVPSATTRREGALVFLRNRLFAILMLGVIGLLLLALLTLSAYLKTSPAWLAQDPIDPFIPLMQNLLSFALLVAFVSISYKILPTTRVHWRDVIWPAVGVALLGMAGRVLLSAYIERSALSSAYGAAGSLVVFLLWMYYSAQVFYFGAAVARALRDWRFARLEA